MYNIIFSYGKDVHLGECDVTAKNTNLLVSHWLATDEKFRDFATLGLAVGDKIFIQDPNSSYSYKTLVSTISGVATGVITMSSNAGNIVYGAVQRYGFVKPIVQKEKTLILYPRNNFCGMRVVSFGESYTTYPEDIEYAGGSTITSTHSVLGIMFKQGNSIEEVRITVQIDKEKETMKQISEVFREENDIFFDSLMTKKNNAIISVNSIVSNNTASGY
jgi:uncharacterized protein affecting Mg2+/Co2+ transport|tara:strand:- start:2769 stop:3422 length:654 start_codon:yes stop_codon:yes gene_type:complete